MYTRFKSQKTGVKLGLNTITKNRVVMPQTVPNTEGEDTKKIYFLINYRFFYQYFF